MNPEPCREMEERLIDYADGTLLPEESRRVAQHIAQCEGCRRAVEALRESIQIADAVWQDTLHNAEATRLPPSRRLRMWKWWYAAAAGFVLAIGGTLFWSGRSTRAPAPPTLAEMERQISESATAARLLAATNVLQEQTREADMAEAQYRHIVEQYPNTDAAAQVRLKLKPIR